MPSGVLQYDTAPKSTNTNARFSVRNTYPDAVALREALQNPAINLCADLDLNRATVARDRNDLPLAFTGRFAVVFRLHLPGDMPVALRLFTAPEKDFVGERAERLRRTTHLLRARQSQIGSLLPPPVYLPEAVRVGGTWYPAQVLPWAEGESLLAFVERHRESPTVLRTLAQTLADAVARLEDAGIAHGDLQHDNLLVADNGRRITLVDYDALYAPELRDLAPPAERGHRHYQHPNRTIAHYGVGSDRFASAVIRTGLLLLAADPSLWTRFGDTGESVLFTESDFRTPERSPILVIARDHARFDATLSVALSELESLLGLPGPVLIASLPRILETSTAPPRHRLPARVTPTCDEEQVKPVSYLAPLFSPQFLIADRVNAVALRAFVFLAPVLVAIAWTDAWNTEGAKWTFLAYLFAVSMGMVFLFLYMTWGVKQQHDALYMELGKLRLAEQRAKERTRTLEQRLLHIVFHPIDPHQERSYVEQALTKIPVSRAIGDFGASPEAIRQLRERGIHSAAQLARRHGFLPTEVPSSDAEILREWLQNEEEIARKLFAREMLPEQRLKDELATLRTTISRHDIRIRALCRETERFPDASLGAFLRRILLPPSLKEGESLVCGE